MYNFNIKTGIILTLLTLFFRCTDAQCTNGRFGPECEFDCHCINNKQCNTTTGDCPAGCDFAWAGPACQHMNVVPAGSYNENEIVIRHSSNTKPVRYGPLAVDRDLSTCSYTNYANQSTRNPWWRVWLKSKHKINHISILTGSKYLDYFKQFQVMVENNTEKHTSDLTEDQQLCYRHIDSVPKSPFIEVKCIKPLFGNQIRILLAAVQTQLVLCDVRIYGECEDDTYGVSCTEKCSLHCKGICNKENGTCDKCKIGWTGSYCTQICPSGKYGDNCAYNCSSFCRNNSKCNHTDGYCLHGCTPGYMGDKCDEKCSSGLYDTDCKQQCSDFCLQKESDYCSHVNGSCIYGCKTGYKGTHCNETCSSAEWGMNCNQSCGKCRKGARCDIGNGSCAKGCMPGYKTTQTCKEECEIGSYGDNCAGECSLYCKDKQNCNIMDGACEQCVAGWMGSKCDKECQDGFYGTDCSLQCGNCKLGAVCNKTVGICHEGCAAGFTGEMCVAKIFQEQATDSSIHLSPAALAGIVLAFVIFIAISNVSTFVVTRNRMQLSRQHNAPESEAVSYSNVLATETSSRDGANDYETLNRKNGSEHIYG